MNSTRPSVLKKPIRGALEDAIVVGLFSLLGALIAAGTSFPPETETLYGAGLAALLAGTVAYARVRRIQAT